MSNDAPTGSRNLSDPKTCYRWKCWWGGETVSDVPPQIPLKLIALRKKVGGLQARKQTGGPAFAIKSSKELEIKLREACDDLDIPVCSPVGVDGGNIDADRGTVAFVKVVQRIGCMDGSFIDFVGIGHGADAQDKAAGKASTYARKDALSKGLIAPDKEMVDTDDEESPIAGGVTARRGGKAAVGPAPAGAVKGQPGDQAFQSADWKMKIASVPDKAALATVLEGMKAEFKAGRLDPDVAMGLVAAAKLREGDL